MCQELFFSRLNQPPASGVMSVGAVVKSVPSWENRDQTIEKLVNMEIPPTQEFEEVNQALLYTLENKGYL